MARTEDHDELKDAPLLRSIPRHDPFVVPDGFFDRFPHQVQARLVEAAHRPVWRRALASPAFRLAFGAAAVVAVAVVVWSVRPDPPPAHVAEVTAPSEASDALLMEEMDDDLVYEAWQENGAPSMAEVDLPLDEDELMAYLENEDIPLDLLIEEL